MNQPYYRIWRPGAGTDFCLDRRNAKNILDLCAGYAEIENQLRRKLTKRTNAIDAPDRALLRLHKQCIFEVQQNTFDICRANSVKVNPRMARDDLQFLIKHLKLSDFSVCVKLYDEAHTLIPFCPESLDEWYLEGLHVLFNRSVDYTHVTLYNCLLSAAAVRILLFAQFGDVPDRLIEGNSKHAGSGFYQRSSIFQIVPPDWSEEESYNFSWDELKTKRDPFIAFPFSG
ncbi:MAG TPA: hypothetical protein PKW41_12900 [Clostridia bacterium]|nr:hypothetical protein [Clostridia bacterium]HPK16889.1 hypothetical protein [Clostridia bacterium]